MGHRFILEFILLNRTASTILTWIAIGIIIGALRKDGGEIGKETFWIDVLFR